MTTFDAEAFLDVTAELAKREQEAFLRTALGRAYYAVFLRWRSDIAGKLGIHDHDVRHHEFLSTVKSLDPYLAGLVQSLQERRICADYRTANPARARQRGMTLHIDQGCAQDALDEARRANQRFRRLYPRSAPS